MDCDKKYVYILGIYLYQLSGYTSLLGIRDTERERLNVYTWSLRSWCVRQFSGISSMVKGLFEHTRFYNRDIINLSA